MRTWEDLSLQRSVHSCPRHKRQRLHAKVGRCNQSVAASFLANVHSAFNSARPKKQTPATHGPSLKPPGPGHIAGVGEICGEPCPEWAFQCQLPNGNRETMKGNKKSTRLKRDLILEQEGILF